MSGRVHWPDRAMDQHGERRVEGAREPTSGTVQCLVLDRIMRGVRPVGHALATLVTESAYRRRSEP